jgi:flagellar basal body rod protein FlgG
MISGIYPYLLSMSVGSLKKPENSSANIANSSINSVKGGILTEKEKSGNAADSDAGIGLTASGSVSQGSTGLFAEVSDLSLGQEIPQMIEAQRGFETYVKAASAQGESGEYALDTFA